MFPFGGLSGKTLLRDDSQEAGKMSHQSFASCLSRPLVRKEQLYLRLCVKLTVTGNTRRPGGTEGKLALIFAQLCAQLGGFHKISFRTSFEVVKSVSLQEIIWQDSLESRLARGRDVIPVSGERQTDDSACRLLGKVTHRTAEIATLTLESDGKVRGYDCEHLFYHQLFELPFSSHVHFGRIEVREDLLTVVSGEFHDIGRLTLGSGLHLLTYLFKTDCHEGVIGCGKRDSYVSEMDVEYFQEEESPLEGLVTGK